MDLREQLRRHRKDTRLILSGLGLLLLVLTAAFYLILRSRELPTFLVNNRVVLFALWYVDVVLILAILFMLLRNLLKVLVERHHRILGAKFKTKLVITFIGLSLIPVLLLFVIATELLGGSVDRWFSTSVRDVLTQGNAVAQELINRIESTTRRDAGRVLTEVEGIDLADPARRPELGRRLQARLGEMELALLAVYDGGDFVAAVVDPQAGITDFPEPSRELLAEALAKGTATRRPLGRDLPGRLILAAAAAPPPAAGGIRPGGREPRRPAGGARRAAGGGGRSAPRTRPLRAGQAAHRRLPRLPAARGRARGPQGRPPAQLPRRHPADPLLLVVGGPLPGAAGHRAHPGPRRRHPPGRPTATSTTGSRSPPTTSWACWWSRSTG